MSDPSPPAVRHDSPTEVAIAVVEQQGCVLIGQRPPGVPLAGLWEFPGGKLQPGELPAEAAIRECREETGLEVEVTGDYPPQVHVYAHGTVRLHFFHCRPTVPATEVTAPFCWVRRQELARYSFPPANQAILQRLAEGGCGRP
jgi:mutator protein MutT